MDGYDVKEVMEQVHISPKMQEEIIMNIQKQTRQENKAGAWSFRKTAAAAAAAALAVGVVSYPVRAFVTNVVMERMESVPKEEIQGLNEMIQSQDAQADGYSREYSDSEKERDRELRKAYENGTFPKKDIAQADSEEEAPEGKLCYIKATSVFNLPAQEMTDEELLEVIDFQHKTSYALSQGTAAQEVKAEEQKKIGRLEKIVQEKGGISGDEAVEIAKEQLKADLGEKADELGLMTDNSGSGAALMDVLDIAPEGELESKADVVYDVGFGNPDTHDTYGYVIDAVDGSILTTWEYNGNQQ